MIVSVSNETNGEGIQSFSNSHAACSWFVSILSLTRSQVEVFAVHMRMIALPAWPKLYLNMDHHDFFLHNIYSAWSPGVLSRMPSNGAVTSIAYALTKFDVSRAAGSFSTKGVLVRIYMTAGKVICHLIRDIHSRTHAV